MALRTTCLGIGALLLAAQLARADTLWDIYQLARQNDPQLREAEATRMATREARPQALGALLPQISATGSLAKNASQSTRSGLSFGSIFSTSTSHTRNDETDWGLQLRQTLFRWDQWVRLRQADKQLVQADLNYRVAELDLYTRVADAYFNVLAAEDTLAANVAAREAIGRQLEQAQKRFEVGLIAITDVQEAQAGYDQSVASEIVAKRQLANSKEVLREIVGDYPGELAKPVADLPLISPEPADENQWVEMALQQNFGLQAAQLDADIARDNINIARSGHLPTVDLVASRNNIDQDGKTNGRFGTTPTIGPTATDQTNDSISLQATLPIFSGGATSSKVQQAVYQHRASKERLERTARQTERSTRDAYQAVITDISRVKALAQALKSAETALQATEAGFEVGTRTTVDVLESRRQLYQAQTNFARSRYDYIVDVLKLKEAAGTLGDEDVQHANSWLGSSPAAGEPALPVRPE
ncbi:MAG: TolC family outer membrane protein [Gammaproteobacteria bacterium]|nr:TolC family outer membrane protein [Gammaproteobacteria bacterium]